MAVAVQLLLGLLCWPLVNSQSFPYVSFMGQTLANHSYVDLSLVGSDPIGSGSLQCITDLYTCCANTEGPHRGDWYFPNGTRLSFSGGGDIFESRGPQRVALHHRNNADSPSGVYRCSIDTNAVHGHYYKWKNHFYEMKGDVGMSVHEKERKQEDAYTKTQTHS